MRYFVTSTNVYIGSIFVRDCQIINLKHPFCVLGATIKWPEYDKAFDLYSVRIREDWVNHQASRRTD
jgi:hypothetical protein